MAQDILFHQSLSYIDQFYPELLRNFKVNDSEELVNKSKQNPTIFVTYHTGSYRLFLHYLAKRNTRFCLVVQQKYIDEHGSTTQQLFQKMSGEQNSVLEVISAEDPRLLLSLRSKVKAGLSVVFYIDGNSGVALDENKEKNNLTKINFLSHHIYARQGIAYLAYITKAPVVSVLSERLPENMSVLNLEEIDVNIYSGQRDEYIRSMTILLYKKLESFLKKSPEQWEGWMYLNNFCDAEKMEIESSKSELYKLTPDKSITVCLDEFTELASSRSQGSSINFPCSINLGISKVERSIL